MSDLHTHTYIFSFSGVRVFIVPSREHTGVDKFSNVALLAVISDRFWPFRTFESCFRPVFVLMYSPVRLWGIKLKWSKVLFEIVNRSTENVAGKILVWI